MLPLPFPPIITLHDPTHDPPSTCPPANLACPECTIQLPNPPVPQCPEIIPGAETRPSYQAQADTSPVPIGDPPAESGPVAIHDVHVTSVFRRPVAMHYAHVAAASLHLGLPCRAASLVRLILTCDLGPGLGNGEAAVGDEPRLIAQRSGELGVVTDDHDTACATGGVGGNRA